ncbi:hypothetical protein A3B45_05275 [Candidatus Daviesbacteria bacterium RIFCSPLOWO2_01_FULL_39_12]|uniref:Uncharacterized protein n=1 Tax=Candidatus Daviesbacteria bacterium RIFCSPLOWO2_01_FULL_39_12 TaxID=1797785 RepID=A0A1F5KQ10_9BACT|nr:MAG: hypothetical protein A3D79_02580 [Candidatus Daviesbacteria bacterium RIFCSPHIGHO2_02_FULL_39_8]OGE43016.1 MAG: hypothetical protein A3B45_05275 [Candidatus Daviesbacteria bacterium RIFCSPLOWO2_01_FULL_39_12]
MKYFYSHLIEIESLIIELDKLDLSLEEKSHLSSLVDSSLHHTILDVVLSQLSEKDKKVFLNHLQKNEHDKIWQFLSSKVDKIEEKIINAAEELKKQLHKDIKDAKKVNL